MPDAPGADVLVVVARRTARRARGRRRPTPRSSRPTATTRRARSATCASTAPPATLLEAPTPPCSPPGTWRALLAAESLGAVERALEASVQYAKERFTFGRAIGSYQAVKHQLVEMLRRLDNARSLMYYAGWAAPDKPDECPLAASAFRLSAGKAIEDATRTQITVHGGIGATWEHDAPLYFRQAQLSRRLLGGTAARPTAWRASCSRRRGGRRPRRSAACTSGRTTAGGSRSPTHQFPIYKYELLRERVVADGLARRTRSTRPSRSVGALARVHDPALLGAHPRRRADRARAARSRPAVVARARRARPALGRRHAAGRARGAARGVAMNLGGGTHHAGRDFARGYCLFNDVALALGELRAEGLVRRAVVVDCDVHQGDGTAHSRPGPRRLHPLAARRAQLPVPADPVRPRRRPRRPARATTPTCGARGRARHALDARAARHRLLPRRRRPVGGRPARPPGAHQGGPARARRARARRAARRRRPGLRRARGRLRGGRARHRRHQRGTAARSPRASPSPEVTGGRTR